MMKFKAKALFAAAMMCALVAVGCNENTDDPIDSTAPAAPTGLMANSKDFETVNLKWTASASANAADFSAYELIVTPANGTAGAPITIAKGTTTYAVTGLTEGTVYTFSLKAKSTATTNNTSSAATVQWSPATRYTDIKLYESASTTNGSGLDFDNNGNYEVILKVNQLRWDLGLDTKFGSNDIGSPKLLSYFPNTDTAALRTTLLSASYDDQTSLDAFFDTQLYAASNQQRLITFSDATKSFIFGARTADGHFAKVLVKSVGGKIFQGTAPNRYILLDVSYQSAVNVPYAFVAAQPNGPTVKALPSTTVKKAFAE